MTAVVLELAQVSVRLGHPRQVIVPLHFEHVGCRRHVRLVSSRDEATVVIVQFKDELLDVVVDARNLDLALGFLSAHGVVLVVAQEGFAAVGLCDRRCFPFRDSRQHQQ